MGFTPHGKKACIDTYIWCAIGAVLGFLMGTIKGGETTQIMRIEEVLVGVFGAFLGAEFMSDMLRAKGDAVQGFGVKFGLAVFGAVVFLGLLALMRRKVGPLKNGKKKSSNRDF